MRIITLLLACLAGAGYCRRVKMETKDFGDDPIEVSDGLATLLHTLNPASGYNGPQPPPMAKAPWEKLVGRAAEAVAAVSDAVSVRPAEQASKFGNKKLAVITGTSSGLGRATARALIRTGQYHVVGAVRDIEKMEVVAELENFPADSFTPMHIELNAFDSVRNFAKELQNFTAGTPIDRLICNAGVYQPSLPYAKWSEDGHEQTMQINYLSHFLLISLLMPDVQRAPEGRIITVGSVTGNDNTVGGGGVYPIADLKQLEGLKLGAKNPIAMFDGFSFIGAKAYKDSKLCLMMLANQLHDRYHQQTGISFSSIYPGCIAESPLFREKRKWFRKFFPIFMKYITGGFVSEEEAGMRLMQVAHDPRCKKSGVYWSWNGGPREGRGEEALEKDGQIQGGGGAGGGWDSIYENDQSDKVLDKQVAADLWKHSTIVTGADWPTPYQPKPKKEASHDQSDPSAIEEMVNLLEAHPTVREEVWKRAGPLLEELETLDGEAAVSCKNKLAEVLSGGLEQLGVIKKQDFAEALSENLQQLGVIPGKDESSKAVKDKTPMNKVLGALARHKYEQEEKKRMQPGPGVVADLKTEALAE
mmetsp:Transcript_103890/g.195588  ORF Transcript_103890/g.195588 Transcript_103890/m.195588 type:complete len:587 (+) Transcript_103890:60-1820(+)